VNTEKIITHNGHAHFDEFLAISLILARHEHTHFFIERREPTKSELNDQNIWVVDIGHKYQPGLRNFDHHQDLSLPASFVQVAEHLELKNILENTPWWSFKDKIDRRGGFNMAKELGIESLDVLNSPLENFILKLFSESPISVYQQMKLFGKNLIDTGYRLKEQISFWENCEQLRVKNKKVIIGYTEETLGSIQYCESLENPPEVRINYDGRGDGWSMSTIKDAEGINFFKIENHEHIKFAHRNGFIAKTKERIPLENVLQLVEMAIV
jgi:uncharacterized protein UPF0160